MQVKYEDIRSKYEEDVKGLIDTKLLLAEARRRKLQVTKVARDKVASDKVTSDKVTSG